MSTSTLLCRKLGVQKDHTIRVVNPPSYYFSLLQLQQSKLDLVQDATRSVDFLHVFEVERSQLQQSIPLYLAQLSHRGLFWLSWPKRLSGIPTDIDKSWIRAMAAHHQLTDVKVCSLDANWSAIKLMHH